MQYALSWVEPYMSVAKRLFDITFATAGLIAGGPVFLVVGLLVKIDSGGPVFFRQERVGQDFRPFHIIKFRTMIVDAERHGPQVTSGGDHRITRVGCFLRKFKLDELPQLFNVLRGEMSFVGPRPEVAKYVLMFEEPYRKILQVKPGITDNASIKFRDEESVLSRYDDPEQGYIKEVLPLKINLYLEYVDNHDLFLDIRIILKTLYAIVK